MSTGLSVLQRIRLRGKEQLLEELCAIHGVSVNEVLSKQRSAIIVGARHAWMRALRSHGLSYPEIGSLSGCDHSSVQYACKSGKSGGHPVDKTRSSSG